MKKFIFLFSLLILTSALNAQQDSAKIFRIKNQNVEIGKYYEVIFPDVVSSFGKLVAVNKSSFLILEDKDIEEINFDDILKIIPIKNYNPDDPNAHKPVSIKPMLSFSTGYLQRSYGNSYVYPNSSTSKFSSLNFTGDIFFKTSDDFGLRIDVNYLHVFGRFFTDNYSYSDIYVKKYIKTESDVMDINLYTLKTGIAFGLLEYGYKFNTYCYLGIGIGWKNQANTIKHKYVTENNVTTVTESSENEGIGAMIGLHCQVRLSYKISPKNKIFLEPTIQYWGQKVDLLYGINGGISFQL